MSTRLPASKRNALISDFNAGVDNPDYEVIPSKTTKGKYTVRKKRVVQEEEEPKEEPQAEEEQEEQNEEESEEPEVDDQTSGMFNPYAYFQEYQLQLNRLMIEQMKALRQNNKYMAKKQMKYKERQKQIRDIFTEVANETKEERKQKEQPPQEEPQQEEQVEEEEHEEVPPINSYFQSNYPQQQSQSPQYEAPEVPQPERPQYQNDYEETLDDMAGTYAFTSRRDRLKAFI